MKTLKMLFESVVSAALWLLVWVVVGYTVAYHNAVPVVEGFLFIGGISGVFYAVGVVIIRIRSRFSLWRSVMLGFISVLCSAIVLIITLLGYKDAEWPKLSELLMSFAMLFVVMPVLTGAPMGLLCYGLVHRWYRYREWPQRENT